MKLWECSKRTTTTMKGSSVVQQICYIHTFPAVRQEWLVLEWLQEPIGLYRDVWIASSRTSLAGKWGGTVVESQWSRVAVENRRTIVVLCWQSGWCCDNKVHQNESQDSWFFSYVFYIWFCTLFIAQSHPLSSVVAMVAVTPCGTIGWSKAARSSLSSSSLKLSRSVLRLYSCLMQPAKERMIPVSLFHWYCDWRDTWHVLT